MSVNCGGGPRYHQSQKEKSTSLYNTHQLFLPVLSQPCQTPASRTLFGQQKAYPCEGSNCLGPRRTTNSRRADHWLAYVGKGRRQSVSFNFTSMKSHNPLTDHEEQLCLSATMSWMSQGLNFWISAVSYIWMGLRAHLHGREEVPPGEPRLVVLAF